MTNQGRKTTSFAWARDIKNEHYCSDALQTNWLDDDEEPKRAEDQVVGEERDE